MHVLVFINYWIVHTVRTPTCHSLDGLEFEAQWGKDIFSSPHRATQPSVQWVPGHFPDYSGLGVALTAHLHLVLKLRMITATICSPSLPVLHITGRALPFIIQNEVYFLHISVSLITICNKIHSTGSKYGGLTDRSNAISRRTLTEKHAKQRTRQFGVKRSAFNVEAINILQLC